MNEEKTKGLVLKLIDYKDADKLASVFTYDFGIITLKFKGVKKEKAKLKAIAQPFVFADFNIGTIGNSRFVTNGNLIDNFYTLLDNYNKTICGYIVLDILKTIIPENKPETELFLLTLSTLKNLEEKNEYVVLIEFILKFLNFAGVGVEFINKDYVYFNKTTGDFELQNSTNSVQLDKNVYITLKKINNNEFIEVNEHTLKQILRLLHNIIFIRLDAEIKSFLFI